MLYFPKIGKDAFNGGQKKIDINELYLKLMNNVNISKFNI